MQDAAPASPNEALGVRGWPIEEEGAGLVGRKRGAGRPGWRGARAGWRSVAGRRRAVEFPRRRFVGLVVVPPAMFLTRSEYDRGVNTFSPEGRLFQVEYAIEAIKLGSTAIGIQTSEGVCLAVEKRITSPLMEPSSIEKIVEIDAHIGCAMSGLIADAKTLIDKARVETQNHWFTYNETMTVESVTQAVSNLALQFGEEDADPGAMSRPFGVALLFGGVDEKGPQLFHMDPSGTFVQCDARAIGSASEGAQSSLQEVYHKSMTLKEAIKSSLIILKQVMEEKLNATNIELATVEPGLKFHMFTKEELEEVIKDI
uniref:Proteasome subunit alpha type-5 n=2 Tax=Ornithorhynchus anatinus TaxID=9258 RepID=F6UT72_ORNAN